MKKFMAMGIARKKVIPNQPLAQADANTTQIPSWMQGEAPTPSPNKKKKPRVDSAGQLARGQMRMAWRKNMATGLGRRTKLDPSPQQPPASAKDQNPSSFKRVTMGIRKGSNAQATKKKNNSGINVY